MTRITCIFRIREKIQATRLLYPMPKFSENLRKFLEELGNLREFPIYENFGFKIFGKSSGVFGNFRKVLENLRKYSEVFGNTRTFSENFGNGSKVFCRCFNNF